MRPRVRTWRRTRPTLTMVAAAVGVFLMIAGAQQVVRASCPNTTSYDPGYGAWQPCNGNGHCFAYKIDDTCTSNNGTGYQCLDYGQLAPGYEWANCSPCDTQHIQGYGGTHDHKAGSICGS